MSDVNRKLLDLISTLVDECNVLALDIHVVDYYGKELAERVIRDGFAGVVRAGPDDDVHELLWEHRFLPTEEALRIVGLKRISSRYQIAQMPGAIGLEDDANLVVRYARDDPDAVAEVRRRHAERREAWAQTRETS